MLKAGFAEIDITPPVGTHIIGYIVDVVSSKVLDPLFARVAVFEAESGSLAFIQLDTLSVRWTQVNDIRQRIQERYGFPGQTIMVTATHNHAGPAVARVGAVQRDDNYIETMVQRVVTAFGQALDNRAEAQVGFAREFDFTLSCNRRVVMRDGTVVAQGTFANPNALCVEGPIDPAISVLAVRGHAGHLLGSMVHFTCHLAGHGSDRTAVSACHPGALAEIMRERGCPVTLYLNGCCGNVNNGFPDSRGRLSKEKLGGALADHATQLIGGMEWQEVTSLHVASETLELPFRTVTEEDIKGTRRGTQRYAPDEMYERALPELLAKIRRRETKRAEVQCLFLDELAMVGMPAELFVECGLQVIESAWPTQATVVGYANGMVGYVPTREAFERGGYETTFADSSLLAPEAGDMLAEAAISIVKRHRSF